MSGIAVTLDQFIEHGRRWPGANIVDGMPWSFEYFGHHVTHETDDHYIVGDLHFHRGQTLIAWPDGTAQVVGAPLFGVGVPVPANQSLYDHLLSIAEAMRQIGDSRGPNPQMVSYLGGRVRGVAEALKKGDEGA